MISSELSVAAEQTAVSRNRLILVVYTLAIFVSALLLFSVQPLFTKMVLPCQVFDPDLAAVLNTPPATLRRSTTFTRRPAIAR